MRLIESHCRKRPRYARVNPDAESVIRHLPSWITHYNEVHPHTLSVIVHPVSSSQLTKDPDRVRSFEGYNTRNLLGMETARFGLGCPDQALNA